MRIKRQWLAALVAVTFVVWGTAVAAPAQTAKLTPKALGKPDNTGKENKPPKASWVPKRIENDAVDEDVIKVELRVDKGIAEGSTATLWTSGSLAGILELPDVPVPLESGEPIELEFTLLQTPDQAGRTLGGTVHLAVDGKNIAQPLMFSLKKTQDDDELDDVSDEEEEEIFDDDGNLAVSWYLGEEPLEELTLDLFEEGPVEILLKVNRTLTDFKPWVTPSLRNHIVISLPEDLIGEEDVLEIGDDGCINLAAEGTQIPLVVELLLGPEDVTTRGGTVHARGCEPPRRTYPATLLVGLKAGDESLAEEEVAPTAIVDAASFEQGTIAPGQIVSIFGQGLGPDELALFELDEEGDVDEFLAGTMVLFDGYAARLLSASAGQINAIVPSAVKGGDVELLVINNNKQSAPFPVPLGPLAPSLFSLTGTGRGQVAALNSDGSVNDNTNPARRGSIVSLYGMGAGPTDPPMDDGSVATEALWLVNDDVRLLIGGVEAEVLYAGSAPGLVGAVVQINARISGGTPRGPQPVLLVVDGIESSDSVTLAVQ